MTQIKGKSPVRPLVRALNAYVPGEQPKIRRLTKLNTNENPYPPSPKVLAAIKGAVDGRLRLYPNPTADALRAKLAKLHGCAPENIIVGNGSDELLALATRAFVEPGESVQFFNPSYSLYPVLAAIHGARSNAVALDQNFAIPPVPDLRRKGAWDFSAPLTFVTTPNAPSGRGYSTTELEKLCRAQDGVVILDEAYVDFAGKNALTLGLKLPHVIVSRTFSKAYSLCFQRVGYFVGHVELIAALQKIRDSYNVNGSWLRRRPGDAGGPAVLQEKFQTDNCDTQTIVRRLDGFWFRGSSQPGQFHLCPSAEHARKSGRRKNFRCC